MKIAVRRTGLTPHVIRVWEKRYGAVTPVRTGTNRRLYSEEDIERLRLLRLAIQAGHTIGQIARLPGERLQALVAQDGEPAWPRPVTTLSGLGSESVYLDQALAAVAQLDAEGLESVISRSVVSLTQTAFIDELVVPLMQQAGDRWREGVFCPVHEHLCYVVIRSYLVTIRNGIGVSAGAPRLVVTTPAGQLHELGGLIAAATAASEGWRVTYLGPNLPAEDIALAVQQNQSRALALSIIYPPDDPHLAGELKKLRRYLSNEIPLLVGGRASAAYRPALDAIGAKFVEDMAGLRAQLELLRSQGSSDLASRQ